jgi:hypothetical protein
VGTREPVWTTRPRSGVTALVPTRPTSVSVPTTPDTGQAHGYRDRSLIAAFRGDPCSHAATFRDHEKATTCRATSCVASMDGSRRTAIPASGRRSPTRSRASARPSRGSRRRRQPVSSPMRPLRRPPPRRQGPRPLPTSPPQPGRRGGLRRPSTGGNGARRGRVTEAGTFCSSRLSSVD